MAGCILLIAKESLGYMRRFRIPGGRWRSWFLRKELGADEKAQARFPDLPAAAERAVGSEHANDISHSTSALEGLANISLIVIE